MSGRVWSEAERKTFAAMRLTGATALQIGLAIGRSSAAVIGHGHRLKMSLDAVGQQARRVRLPVVGTTVPIDPRIAAFEDLPAAPGARRLSIVGLTGTTCRWPLGDPLAPNFSFCGAGCAVEKAYCGHHHEIAHPPRAAAKAAYVWKKSLGKRPEV